MMKTSSDIREDFLAYFEERGHRRVSSSSLVPQNDATLLFTNAGMNQFKEVFLGLEKRDYQRAASSQKCMRVSGKHNDLETVGRTARHHTFFEMLGNFSFGDYFKKEAIEFAWELCTEVYGLPREQLFVTVFRQDDAAFQLWKEHIGIPAKRLSRMDEKDNFWAMGETGPCGPCSELHFDLGTSPVGHTDCGLECECGRYVELWNLVFMQFNRDESGRQSPLPSPSIDTGMGLERISCVLQGKRSNYETDLFLPLLEEASRLTGTSYGEDARQDISLRILADHSRACTFLIHDGVVPGNEGRGYVLRKILRRALRHGRMLGLEEPFFYTLTALVSEIMKGAYPELLETREYTAKLVQSEEVKFASTLSQGMEILEELTQTVRKKGETRLPGSELFRLYDTYGFPLDLAREVALERGLEIDEAGFQAEMEKQRQRARASWRGGRAEVREIYRELAARPLVTEFTGYEQIEEVPGRILELLKEGSPVEVLEAGQQGEVVLDRTPFYAEAGGQVADQGTVRGASGWARIEYVWTPLANLRLHRLRVEEGALRRAETVSSTVCRESRSNTARNHTATHLLHASLREVLGEHVKQAGSLVAPDHLRFDFTHYRRPTPLELRRIEELVNLKIRENLPVQTRVRPLEEAIQEGAMALFGEKYQERVRVVQIPGFSMELCGGTHVERTGTIGLFKIVGEGSVSAGVRRVEALTGEAALERFLTDEALIEQLSRELRVSSGNLVATVARLSTELKELRRRMDDLRLEMARRESTGVLNEVREIAGVPVLARSVEGLDRGGLRQLADQLKQRLRTGVVVLGAPMQGRVGLVVMVSSDLTDRLGADTLIQRLAPLVEGGGGGRPEMAEAGGKNPERLEEALVQSYEIVREILAS